MKNQLAALLLVCLAQAQTGGESFPTNAYISVVPQADVVAKQAYIWVSVTLAFFLLMTLCVLCRMDPDKSQDTLLYAKFIANTDKKKFWIILCNTDYILNQTKRYFAVWS